MPTSTNSTKYRRSPRATEDLVDLFPSLSLSAGWSICLAYLKLEVGGLDSGIAGTERFVLEGSSRSIDIGQIQFFLELMIYGRFALFIPASGVPPTRSPLAHDAPLELPDGSSPDVTRLLTSNNAPFDSEIPFIRHIVSKRQDTVATLNAQLDDLRATLEQWPDSATRPWIMSTVIGQFCPREDKEIGKMPPWHLGHICRSWRLSALGFPSFWSSITVPFPPTSPNDTPRIQAQLLRSAQAPLKVYSVPMDDTDTPNPHAVDLVLAQCSRWSVLCINLCYSSVELGWLRPVNGRLFALEKLVLINGPDVVIPTFFRELYACVKSSSPTTVSSGRRISYIQFHGSKSHYRGTYKTPDQLAILAAASNLLQCGISFEPHTQFEPHDSSPVTLPRLRSLWIDMPRFIPHLSTPLLEALFCDQGEITDLRALSLPIFRSLKKLVLMSCVISPELITVLRGLPTLTFLIIETHRYYPGIDGMKVHFDAMAICGTSHDLCPNLTFIGYGLGEEFAQDRFFAMAYSRCQPEHPGLRLARLRLFCAHDAGNGGPPGSVQMLHSSMEMLRDEVGLDAAFLEGFTLRRLRKKGYFQDYSFDHVQVDS
ncbi:hypothetical protein B0H13DRAFT_1923627 [Mycena leptocephala]|nr:hypothetical protein B0H13DRAFT_1923627 [Mycena leptocephala]